jgi:hypothetical protein
MARAQQTLPSNGSQEQGISVEFAAADPTLLHLESTAHATLG